MAPRTDFPPVRACLFDMDGLLVDTEDLYTLSVNLVLDKYGRPPLPWTIKAKLQGRPGPEANKIFSEWAQLPITREEYQAELSVFQQRLFPTTKPLPGVPELLAKLDKTNSKGAASGTSEASNTSATATAAASGSKPVHVALATSSHAGNFRIKTAHLSELFSVFPEHRKVLGDDSRLQPGRGKPLPDIFLLALKTINDSLEAGEKPIAPEECLVFEDSVPGVEAGRRAGMRVIWCPHPKLKELYTGREEEVLAGRTGEAGEVDLHQVGQLGDGWGQELDTLESFPYETYGIVIP